MSQKHIARAVGITPSMMSTYETDKCEPRLARLRQILRILGQDLAALERVLDGGPVEATPLELALEQEEAAQVLLEKAFGRRPRFIFTRRSPAPMADTSENP
jgi:transcriptional regulator with XRE-family HTH domain